MGGEECPYQITVLVVILSCGKLFAMIVEHLFGILVVHVGQKSFLITMNPRGESTGITVIFTRFD